MKQKRLMLLGGLRYLIPVIKVAHQQGYWVITCDNIPHNIAHKYSDEYINVSIVDREEILNIAKEKQIDGIMSFACDPGVITASYVQEKMGLPSFGPYESVLILQNKDRFRAFLEKHGFNVPKAKGYSRKEEAIEELPNFIFPIIVKPTDSAGSKGVSRVDNEDSLPPALDYAFKHSISKRIIIEEFIEKKGCSSDSDCFCLDGKLVFVSYNAQRFDLNAVNPYTPAAYSWPSTFTMEQEKYLTSEIQRLISLLGMKTSVYNVETRIGKDDKPYIMEFTPRGGGNRLCEMLKYTTGVDLITAITRVSVGDPIDDIKQQQYNGHWAEIILHADHSGIFDHIEISDYLPAIIIEKDIWVQKHEYVNSFEGANNAIGTLVLKFQTAEDLEYTINHQSEWLKVVVI